MAQVLTLSLPAVRGSPKVISDDPEMLAAIDEMILSHF